MKNNIKKTIVITGIGGYLGSTLAEILASEYNVIGYGHKKKFSLLQKKFGKTIQLEGGDIENVDNFFKHLKGVYAVIHTAAPTHEVWCQENPWNAYNAIVVGTKKVCEAVKQNHIPLFIHISTQAVYSNFKKKKLPLREDMNVEPDTLYGTLKALAEKEIQNCASSRARSLKTVIIRPSNIYGFGSGILRNNVIHAFVKNSKEGKSLTLQGGGTQKADFVHVEDIVRLVEKCLKNKKKFASNIFNAGSGKSVSVKEIANIVKKEAKKYNKNVVIKSAINQKRVAADRYLSISSAKRVYGWKPEISLRDGINELFSKI